ncbi:MAG: hypothetical protein LBR60_05765 [Fibrobacter sp.]|jgi:hypothetical protein|nr:hypothetical protein [Fibrobacter sp.]
MKKIVIPSVLLVLIALVFLYLKIGFSGSSFDGSRYLAVRAQIDSVNTELWNTSGETKNTLLAKRDSLWGILDGMQSPSKSGGNLAPEKTSAPAAENGNDLYFWVVIVTLLTIVLLGLIVLIFRKRRDGITRQMEAIKEEQRFKAPKGGFQDDSEFQKTRARVRRSIVDEAVTIAESEGRVPAEKTVPKDFLFEDENGIPENKIISESPGEKPPLRPTARERITSAMQSLSDVLLRTPKGITRANNAVKPRVQSRNTLQTTLFPSNEMPEEDSAMPSPLEMTRFDKEREDCEKILQMRRRGYTSSEIARRMQMDQEQVETMIRLKRDDG